MAQVGAIRNALQDALSGIDGLHAYDVGTGRERLSAAIVWPVTLTRVTTCDGEELEFAIEVFAGLGKGLPRAQDELDAYISTAGSKSIPAALESDKTLGGVVSTLRVGAAGGRGSVFEGYTFGELNTEGQPNSIRSIVPVVVRV